MTKLRLKPHTIDRIKSDRNLVSDFQVAAILGTTVEDVEAMRQGEPVSRAMALHVAEVQGSGFDLSEWVEYWTPHRVAV
ncbi:hypothetical protein QVA66_03765 [Staphylococcus chromogenes]|nr:hypothetical protein [Staphylococcus chromogenes]